MQEEEAGYYGGYAFQGTGTNSCSGGAGGSSYVSGMSGCTTYNNYVFNNGITIAGNALMPNPNGGAQVTGNSGNGVAKITILSLD